MRRAPPWFKKKKTVDTDKDFVSVHVSMPKEQYETLKKASEERMLPLSRLVCYAIDNEIECQVPFNYPCEMPSTVFIEDAYVDEAGRILAFLKRFGSGLSKDMIMLFRRTIGIQNKTVLMLALRELLESNMAVETANRPYGQQFEFHPTHTWIRLSDESREHLEREKLILKRQQEKLAKREKELLIKEQKIHGISRLQKTSNSEETEE